MKMGSRAINMAGLRYGNLTGISPEYPAASGDMKWKFRCDCGAIVVTTGYSARSGKTTSCRDCTKLAKPSWRTKHGMSDTDEFKIWTGILTRCLNKNSQAYSSYGAKGIDICDRWKESFESFFNDMGHRPSKNHSIDRIDNEKGYSPSNCRWATKLEQARNKRRTLKAELNGELKPITQIAEEHGVTASSVRYRFSRGKTGRGLIEPPAAKYTFDGITDTVFGWSKRTGIKQTTIAMRLSKYGWPVEKALTKGAIL